MAEAKGAVRTRLGMRESFFGGPVSTREQSKAPGWQAFVKEKEAKQAAVAGAAARAGSKGGSRPGGSKAAGSRQAPAPPPPDPEQERLKKLKQRRDFSGLDSDEPPPPPAPRVPPAAGGSRQQTAAGPPPRQRSGSEDPGPHYHSIQQRQRGSGGGSAGAAAGVSHGAAQQRRVVSKAVTAGGGGKKAAAARGMAVEVTAVGKGRKQLASEALKARVGTMIAQHGRSPSPGPRGAVPASAGSPTRSGTAGGSAGATAVAAARAAREAGAAKAVLQNKQYKTAHGMQTLQLVRPPPGQPRGGATGAAAAGGGGTGVLAAMRTGAGGPRPRISPGSVTKGQRPGFGGAGRSPAGGARAGAAGGAAGQRRPQFKGAFYGGKQPPAALEARMQYNKRRLSLDSGGDLDSFIASDDDGEGWGSGDEVEQGGEEDWRALLRDATGGYDPSKYADIDRMDDRDMEAGYSQIELEERRALRIARAEDEREAEREALREAAKREKKKRKKGAAAFLDMGD